MGLLETDIAEVQTEKEGVGIPKDPEGTEVLKEFQLGGAILDMGMVGFRARGRINHIWYLCSFLGLGLGANAFDYNMRGIIILV